MYLCDHCHKTSQRGEPLYRLPIVAPLIHPGNHPGKRTVRELKLCPRCRELLAQRGGNGQPVEGGQP